MLKKSAILENKLRRWIKQNEILQKNKIAKDLTSTCKELLRQEDNSFPQRIHVSQVTRKS